MTVKKLTLWGQMYGFMCFKVYNKNKDVLSQTRVNDKKKETIDVISRTTV